MKDDLSGRTDRFISDLGVTETASALSRLRREGRMSSADVGRIHARLLDDIAAGVFERAELSSEIHRMTEHRLLVSGNLELRASDALHLGLAIGSNCLCMVSYDRRLTAASLRAGLTVYPNQTA